MKWGFVEVPLHEMHALLSWILLFEFSLNLLFHSRGFTFQMSDPCHLDSSFHLSPECKTGILVDVSVPAQINPPRRRLLGLTPTQLPAVSVLDQPLVTIYDTTPKKNPDQKGPVRARNKITRNMRKKSSDGKLCIVRYQHDQNCLKLIV